MLMNLATKQVVKQSGRGRDVLTIRNKKGKQEKLLLFTWYSDTAVHLGAYLITFAGLLCDYEYTLDGSEWLPFGIEC